MASSCSLPSRLSRSPAVANLDMVSSRGSRSSWWGGDDDRPFTSCLLSRGKSNDGAVNEITGTARLQGIGGYSLRAVADASGGLGYSRIAPASSAVEEKSAPPGKKPGGILQRIAMTASDRRSEAFSQSSAPLAPTRSTLPSNPIERFSEKYKVGGNTAGRKHPASHKPWSPSSSRDLTASSRSSPLLGADEPAGATSTSLMGRLVSELRARTSSTGGDGQRSHRREDADGQHEPRQKGRVDGGVEQPGFVTAGVEKRLNLQSSEVTRLKV